MRTIKTLLIACSLLFNMLAVADSKEVTISTVDYVPYYGKDLPQFGPLIEVIREAFKLEGIRTKVEFMPWSRALKLTKEGGYNALCCAWYREDRKEHLTYSSALPGNVLSFVKRAEQDISFSGFESLKSFQIGVVRDYALPEGFEEANLSSQVANNDQQNIKKLLGARIDLALMDEAQARFLINSDFPKDKARLDFVEPSIKNEPQYLVFSKAVNDTPALVESFNSGLQKLKDSGRFNEILKRHKFID